MRMEAKMNSLKGKVAIVTSKEMAPPSGPDRVDLSRSVIAGVTAYHIHTSPKVARSPSPALLRKVARSAGWGVER